MTNSRLTSRLDTRRHHCDDNKEALQPCRHPESANPRPAGTPLLTVRRSLVFAAGLALLTVVGCQNQDEIRHYQVPRLETPAVRMLAAMVPHGDNVWFFKVLGPAPAVEEQKERFDRFMHSVRFTGDKERPLTWTMPEGWREEAKEPQAQQMPGMEAYATFRLPTKERELELSVVLMKQQGNAGSVLENVKRWRTKFLGLPAVSEEELSKITTTLKIGDSVATLMDMTGPGPRAGMAEPMQPPAAPARAQSQTPQFTIPEGWQRVSPKAFSVATFKTGPGERAAEVTVSSVGGGLLMNVNRWRTQQLGLPPVNEEQLQKDIRTLDVAGSKGAYIELIGPEKEGRAQAILGVVADHAGAPWVFKLTGPAETVAAQKAAFEAFVRSVHFGEGKGMP
jgi:hypothetical protein